MRATSVKRIFVIGAVLCFKDSFGVAECYVFHLKISADNPVHRKSAKR